MNSVFSEQILADKLTKLNSTQQCIETLSHWCIFHQSKAEQVVSTWDKQFHSSEMAHKIPYLYLANDILQNSKRKGNEFVTEFWKVLPAAVKDIFDNGDDHGKTVVSRLVNIWEERRVFGSRAQGLKDLMLGKELLPALELSKKRSRAVRILKRDSRSKLSTGGTTEKIVLAFHAVLSEHSDEDVLMHKCKSSVHRVRKMEKEVEVACRTGVGTGKRANSNTAPYEAWVAQAQVDESCHLRKRLSNEIDVLVPNSNSSATATTPQVDSNGNSGETHKRTAAAIADKLAASTSSQQIMSAVLSSFVKQEAKKSGLTSATTPPNSFTVASTNPSSDMRLTHERPMTVADSSAFIAAQPLAIATSNPYQTVLIHQSPMHGHPSTPQPQYHLVTNTPSQQYLQASGGIVTGLSYGYSNMVPPPPPPSAPPPPPLI
ncbi:hypothetical protein IFM89_032929 [Coptis chinensis]|uniref:CID domain-containing protein n=1 Tax=Coptis chinensis TaxID=261450 RepID=A0A835M2B2_9MAGN|nr:hypothetical protein IFM89_032929 [Coptis chinensis]